MATNTFKAVNVTGHIGAVDMAELLDELAERPLALFREALVAVKEEASGFPSIKIGGLGHIGSGGALAAQGEELVVNLGVDFNVKTNGAGTGRMFKGGEPSFRLKIGTELEVPIVPLGIVTIEFGRFSDVTGM